MRGNLRSGVRLCAALALLSPPRALSFDAGPYEITLQADVRAVAVDSPYRSYLNAGWGLLRFDEDHEGLRLGRLFADVTGPITDTVRANLTLSATQDRGAGAIDVTEGYIEWRPVPTNALRWRTKIGGFYPPVSLENRAIGWESPYTISASAINTWIGEEARAYGVEQTLAFVEPSRRFEVSFVGSGYVWNDPMGVLVFQRGWAIHDRQTGVFGSVARPIRMSVYDGTIEFNKELDNRIGYYAGLEIKYGPQVVRVLRYDNRGDPAIANGKETAWLSRFNSLGWRYELPTGTTLIAQGLKGNTSVGPSADGRGMLIGEFWSYFFLASQRVNDHRLSARYDRMFVNSTRGANIFLSRQTAAAWTFAYLWDIDPSWQLAVEALRVQGSLQQRALKGLPPAGVEKSWQIALRYSL